ncbi:NAD-dependent epimerase/dehydratase family protein [Dactylosporangium sp. NPDC050588]|uniref:NAD-dependent epimerase/dehydratase family protein n=1 Tax=Dactylosporangium sp. NPDC050588 TaxID=3157211 RepID=UPI00340A03E9
MAVTKTVLVTGASGFIGSHLAATLSESWNWSRPAARSTRSAAPRCCATSTC